MVRLLFFQPQIPPNTGNAIRLSAVTGAELHLVEPLGFELTDAQLRRAGLDYHDLANVTVHPDFDAACSTLGVARPSDPDRETGDSQTGAGDAAAAGSARLYAFTVRATTSFTDVTYRSDDVLLFGPEATGLPDDVLGDPRVTERLRIPMLPARRSLNLGNSAALAVYEAWRQQGFRGAG